MSKSDKLDIMEIILNAQAKSYKIAFETAVRTGTALIYVENGKLVEVRPPFKYVMVPIESEEKPKKAIRGKKK